MNQNLNINFQCPDMQVPPIYAADTGEPFDEARGYGWDCDIS